MSTGSSGQLIRLSRFGRADGLEVGVAEYNY